MELKLKILLLLGLMILPISANAAAITEDSVYNQQKYSEDGKNDAQAFFLEYQDLNKPAFKNTYISYMKDLEKIALNGQPPYNEELYKDLLQMNSNEPFVYRQTKARGNLYKNYKFKQ